MAWKDAWSYTRKIMSGDDNCEEKVKREDSNLPLSARIGSVVNLQKTPLIRAQSQGSLVEMPSDDETLICAISRIQSQMQGELYRYYLHVGDDDHAEKFLQLYLNTSGEIVELLYCSRLTRLIPQSAEDQDAYSGAAGYGLGDRSYTLWREQIAGLGFDESSLHAIFAGQDSLVYQRDAGSSHDEFITPFKGTETRIDDAAGNAGVKQEIIFMPYGRALGREQGCQREVLLISTEIIESENGDRAKRGIYVDFMIGIPIELDRLVVQ
jgi:hypothetical protein